MWYCLQYVFIQNGKKFLKSQMRLLIAPKVDNWFHNAQGSFLYRHMGSCITSQRKWYIEARVISCPCVNIINI